MRKHVKHFLETCDEEVFLSKKELVLTLTTCTLAGILLGIFLSPKKKTMIGCHNGCNSGNNDTHNDYDCNVDDFDDDFFVDEDDCDNDDCLSFN